ncbi:head-tail connector protein [Prosthecomicrobium pneumaticum]|uniref:Putative phiE125 gp8 family phage protein n=1 Tax=Prosthecomicrobium pneumaticum TaxID=81895 RepID=A0A7W9FR54_9HYPH|nr:head-tail connector protein [Prosthecomicrobium pneumaticum]MBB5755282.1 putative phiE125 gp8 family phage protein [Prosthecomicrobium pneumaticum]
MTVALIEAPAIEPVSVAEAKAHLRLDGSEEDGLVAAAIAAARIHVEAVTGRALIAQDWRLHLDRWPAGRRIGLPVAPLIAVAAITTYDAAGMPHGLDAALWRAEPAGARVLLLERPAPGLAWNGIEIDFTAGYGSTADDVPAPLRQAILILVAQWHAHRGAIEPGAAPPAAVEALLAPYRLRTL